MVQRSNLASPHDAEFMTRAAEKILGTSTVATSTAERLIREGIEATRLAGLVGALGREVTVGSYKFKLIDADPETPANFGVLVRRMNPTGGTSA